MQSQLSRTPWAVTIAVAIIASALIAGAYWAKSPPSPGFSLGAAIAVITTSAALIQAAVGWIMMRGLDHARVQAEAAQAGVEDNRAAVRMQQRAYVGMGETTFAPGGAFGFPDHLSVPIINAGATPALDVKLTYAYSLFRRGEFNPNIPGEPEERSKSPILPGGKQHITIEGADWPNDEQWRPLWGKWRQGQLDLHFWGAVEYRDIFGEHHITRFHYISRTPNIHTFATAGDGNDAT